MPFFARLDLTCFTVPTLQPARTIAWAAVEALSPLTFGTTHFEALEGPVLAPPLLLVLAAVHPDTAPTGHAVGLSFGNGGLVTQGGVPFPFGPSPVKPPPSKHTCAEDPGATFSLHLITKYVVPFVPTVVPCAEQALGCMFVGAVTVQISKNETSNPSF